MDEFGREDLAVVSYHMGIGNLQGVLGAFGQADASYAQLYFDAPPDSHPRAYRLLAGLGDDSKTYYWRVLASREVMRLYRGDRGKLERLAGLQAGAGSASSRCTRPRPTDVRVPGRIDEALEPPAAARSAEPRHAPRPRGASAGGRRLRPEAYALVAYMRGRAQVSGVTRRSR